MADEKVILNKTGEVNPIYEVITREALTGAFRDAVTQSTNEILSRINSLISTFTAVAAQGLFVLDFTARMDYDKLY